MSAAVISALAHEAPLPVQRANENDNDNAAAERDDADPPTVRSASYADVPCVREPNPPDTLRQHAHAPFEAALDGDDETLPARREDLPL